MCGSCCGRLAAACVLLSLSACGDAPRTIACSHVDGSEAYRVTYVIRLEPSRSRAVLLSMSQLAGAQMTEPQRGTLKASESMYTIQFTEMPLSLQINRLSHDGVSTMAGITSRVACQSYEADKTL